jgi:hypothetical protein
MAKLSKQLLAEDPMLNRFTGGLAALAVATILVACGGGGTPTTTISGSAVKGPVDGATVTVKDANGNVLGTTTTNSTGGYTINVNHSGDVVVEVSGGTYTDEATGAKTTLASPLKVVLAASGGNVTGMVTPLTTMAFNSATSGGAKPSSANFKKMATALATQFKLTGVDLATTLPAVTGSPNDYGKVLAAVSQYLKDNSKSLGSLVGAALSDADWTAFSGSFTTAYKAANGGTVTFAFDGSAFKVDLGTTAGAAGGGTSATINVTAGGVSLPAISVSGLPTPTSQSDFCDDITADPTFSGLGTGGATLTVNSCSYSGKTGTVNATLSGGSLPMSIPYVIAYTYN